MNVYATTRLQDYLRLTFITAAGTEVILFDNMEIRARLDVGEGNYPEVFNSAGGYASALPRLQPRLIRAQIQTWHHSTICKLKDIVRITRGRYRLKVCVNGFWDCIKTVEHDPDGGASLMVPGQISGAVLPATTRIPVVGNAVLINGMGPVVFTQAQYDAWQSDRLALVPYCLNAVIRYDAGIVFRGQARGLGARRNDSNTIEFLETVDLTLPPYVQDTNEQGDTGDDILQQG